MKLLAIDTSSLACSVALQSGGHIEERHEEQEREHTRLLTPMIRDVLASSGAALADLDAIVLGNGPGSFIGMRIAASVAQGLAHGSGTLIVPVSSLAAVAAEIFATSDAAEVVVAQDAHMNEAYLGVFTRGQDDLPEERVPERLQSQTRIEELDEERSAPRVAAGFGWRRYPALLEVNRPVIGRFADVLYPRARFLLGLGKAGVRCGEAIEPEHLVPAYLRSKVAEKPRGVGS
ncbi:MAG: tRNA (adenosine(37)-N6)-threonylcarbamoyltransferase complex dimerization subunit type 1 TsaB [Woeseiaceae bacterium]|nr:tRNA (adenosine(37)-N6)-threonylcarbamoyltransferase complex dimerization subunit type 1 TsaB [Woeseiaceae bacterium]